MANNKLTEQEIERLTQHLRENGTLPAAYKEVLFPPEKKAKEYRLEYDGKEREEDILADTWSAPFQPIKIHARQGGVLGNAFSKSFKNSDSIWLLYLPLRNSSMIRSSNIFQDCSSRPGTIG